jgi:hypothetical protein
MHVHDVLVHGRRSTASIDNASMFYRCEGKKASLKDVLGKSNIKSKSHDGSSTRYRLCAILL